MFTIICAWCGKVIKDHGQGSPVTHLICVSCYHKEMKKLTKPRFYPPQPPPQPPTDL